MSMMPPAALPFMAAVLLAVAGCGRAGPDASGVVVARVGDEAIGEAELHLALADLEAGAPGSVLQLRGEAVNALIDQRLLSRAARDEKLDASPDVRLAMEHAQRTVLSEAYMARRYAALEPPTETEINDYYLAHPELFANRRLYHMQEINLTLPASRLAEVETRLRQSRSVAEFSAWLGMQGIVSEVGQTLSPAEQIPAPFLAQLKDLKDGQVIVQVTGKNQIRVVHLLASETQALSPERARAAIERVLTARARKARLDSEIEALRRNEKVEYVQGFSPLGPGPTPTEY